MAPRTEVQKAWRPLIEGLGFKKKGSHWDYHLPFNDEWTGVVSLSVMSNYGTGSSVSVGLGPLWVPHMQLRNELTLITPDRGDPSYTESLYHLDQHLDERLGVAWPVQFDGPHSPIDLSAPFECLVEQGLPYLRDVLCTVEHTLEVFRERSYLPGARFTVCQYYILALELAGNHAEAVRQLEYFVARHEQAEERLRSTDFVEFVRRFEARFGM